MIKAVLFDMDGVIFDTERINAKGWKQVAARYQIALTDERIGMLRGRTADVARNLFHEWFGDEVDYDEARGARLEMLMQHLDEHGTPLKPGVREIFSYLKENHIKTALATSTQRERVEIYFEKGNLPLQFDATVCGREVKNGKPAPDVFLKAAELLGVEPGECLVIEDSYNGIRAANAAGCQIVMVPDMDEPTEETKAVCAQTVDSLYDVIRYLDELKELSEK